MASSRDLGKVAYQEKAGYPSKHGASTLSFGGNVRAGQFDDSAKQAEGPVPELPRVMGQLIGVLDRQDVLARELLERMSGLVTPPVPVDALKQTEKYLSPFAISLGDQIERISATNEFLEDLLRRIQT